MQAQYPLLALLMLNMALANAQEICNNAIDDDFDGLIDLNDTVDCACSLAVVDTVFVPVILSDPGFECYTALPWGISQLGLSCDWLQPTTPTTDYFVQGGYFPSIIPTPIPDGLACVGGFFVEGWQEYFAVCLSTPLVAGSKYTLSIHVAMTGVDGSVSNSIALALPPTEIAIYGSSSCVSLPLSTTDCPATSPYFWDILGTSAYEPLYAWAEVQLTFTPASDCDMIMIGPPCGLSGPFVWYGAYAPYMFYDALSLVQVESISNLEVGIEGSLCNEDLELFAHPDSSSDAYQWYADGVAISGATDTILPVSAGGLAPGPYQFVQGSDTASCTTSWIWIPYPEYPDPAPGPGDITGCAPLLVNFTNNADSALTGSTLWNFGDGYLSGLNDPGHTYPDTGQYVVSIIVTSPDGCIGVDTLTVTVDDCTSIPEPSNAIDALDISWENGTLTITAVASGSNIGSLRCYDDLGRMILDLSNHPLQRSASIDLSALPNGIYLLHGEVDHRSFTLRLAGSGN